LDDKKMPTIALAPATEVALPVAERTYVFKIGPNALDSAALLGTELKADGVQRIALLTTSDRDGTDSANAITAQLRGRIELVSRKTFKSTDTDLTQQVQDAVDNDPDAIVVSAFPSQADAVAQAARAINFPGKIYFDSTAAGDLFLAGSKAGSEGVRMIAPQTMVIDDVIATSPAKTDRKNWFAAYTSKYGTFSGFSTYAADAVQLVANTVTATGGTDHAKMKVAMESAQFEGLSGPLQFTPDNHSGLMPQALTTLIVRSGRWRLLA
jgi:branched-chain amino acid transport system substrate-binding protein